MAGSRSIPYETSRRRLGITRERMALVENGFGAASVTTFEAENIGRTLGQIMTSKLPFDGWFRERLEALHGVNLTGFSYSRSRRPTAVPIELLFEWRCPTAGAFERRVAITRPACRATLSSQMDQSRPSKSGQGQLVGNTLGQPAGKFGRLMGTLQEKYGYNRERAAKELKRRMGKHAATR